jgi:uncharacterized protein YjbI with pentapeptide repeats
MANPEHIAILKQGVEQWNKWRDENPELCPNLAEAIFDDTNLNWANLRSANLSRARFKRAHLVCADLWRANLEYANLREAVLRKANLTETNLGQADLSWAILVAANLNGALLNRANLFRADFWKANLNRADFTKAELTETNLGDVDLSTAIGLEATRHEGPSTIGIDTFYKSGGKIPEAFLCGCGVPNEFITYISSMVGRPIEYYSCFISYSTKDQAFADRLYADLQAKGVRCWFASHDIKGGRKINEQIDEAIRVHDKLLLILSEHSMTSDWVGTEIANARDREARDKKQMLFPITIAPFEEVKEWKLFDADRGTDSARAVREYHIPDFSSWARDHGKYQRALERLVQDLKAAVVN